MTFQKPALYPSVRQRST